MRILKFLLCLVLISEASNSKGDGALIKDVKSTLGVCSDIVDAVGDFLDLFKPKEETRRLGSMVIKYLKTCAKIIEIVDAFRVHHFSPLTRGYIALQFDEARFLNKELKGVSKKLGQTLFVASRDGDHSTKFHSACDDKGPTVIIVKTTTGSVFGAYADGNWKGSGYLKSTKAFLFRLRPTMLKYTVKRGREKFAMFRRWDYGPTFGNSHDLYIASGALSSTKSHTRGGGAYTFPSNPSYQLSDGSQYFQVKEYIVLQAVI